jgi:hypothetical protein
MRDIAARGPRRSFEADSDDVFSFINLKGELETFDFSIPAARHSAWLVRQRKRRGRPRDGVNPIQSVWSGRADDRLDEMLVRLGARWVLVSSTFEPAESVLTPNREVTQQDACFWLRWLNEYRVPAELEEFSTCLVGCEVPTRLSRDWVPTLDLNAEPLPEPVANAGMEETRGAGTPASLHEGNGHNIVTGSSPSTAMSDQIHAAINQIPRAAGSNRPFSAENRAMAVALERIKDGRSIAVSQIAKDAGCSPSYLYRCKRFIVFMESVGVDRASLTRGSKDRDTRALEAWDADD